MDQAASSTRKQFDFRHKLASGIIRDVEVYSSSITVKGKKLLYSIIFDVTERNSALADLLRSNKDLEYFAYVASHDLQEPLRNVAGALQMLEKSHKGKFDEKSDQLIEYAVNSAKKMKALIQDLLTYSRITAQTPEVKFVDSELALHRCLSNLKSLIEETGTSVTFGKLPLIRGDFTQLVQVFQNLVANAIKFGPADSPQVHVSATRDGNEVVFCVQDNGRGIEKKFFDRIFVIFQQLERKQSFQGTGIGLAIVKKIVENNKGRVWVESTIGLGSKFYFSFPDGL
jgi:light-regulated signal transduction histidine kinase (bacteriophytochrome)